jgi:hypothetical protein
MTEKLFYGFPDVDGKKTFYVNKLMVSAIVENGGEKAKTTIIVNNHSGNFTTSLTIQEVVQILNGDDNPNQT